jgi:hypothetical protein
MHGYFVINATEILPYVKIPHENNIFWYNYNANEPFLEKFTMQMIHYWKIYHETKTFLENLPCK